MGSNKESEHHQSKDNINLKNNKKNASDRDFDRHRELDNDLEEDIEEDLDIELEEDSDTELDYDLDIEVEINEDQSEASRYNEEEYLDSDHEVNEHGSAIEHDLPEGDSDRKSKGTDNRIVN